MKKRLLTLLSAATLAMASNLSAAVIYFDNFSGAAGDLNGTAPDVRPGSETWTATTAFQLSGSDTLTLSNAFNQSAWLPVTLGSDIYTLSADISVAGTDWVGFTFSNTSPNVFAQTNFAGILIKSNGAIEFMGSGKPANLGAGTYDNTVTTNWSIVLDTTTPNYTVDVLRNSVSILTSTWTTSTNPSIAAVSLLNGINQTTTPATVDNFQLATVPEPSTYAALAGLLALGAVMIRRRRS